MPTGENSKLTYALFAFVVAAIAGLILASFVLRGNFAPWMLSLLHAAVGTAGLILLGFAVLQGADGRSLIAFGALLVAALAGFYLAFLHLREKVAQGRHWPCRRRRAWCRPACRHDPEVPLKRGVTK